MCKEKTDLSQAIGSRKSGKSENTRREVHKSLFHSYEEDLVTLTVEKKLFSEQNKLRPAFTSLCCCFTHPNSDSSRFGVFLSVRFLHQRSSCN